MLTNYYEYHFLYINGIHHVESRNVQGMALMKLYFHPGTDMAQAMAETIGYVNRARCFMPPGTVSPFVMRFDAGSVPVGYLVLSSKTKTIGEIQDQALFKVRPMFASLPGVSAPPPFGGNQRTIVVHVDPDRYEPIPVARRGDCGSDDRQHDQPVGQRSASGDRCRSCPINAMVVSPKELGNDPAAAGGTSIFATLAPWRTAPTSPPAYALVNGRRAVYILVTKRADASTLSVVATQ